MSDSACKTAGRWTSCLRETSWIRNKPVGISNSVSAAVGLSTSAQILAFRPIACRFVRCVENALKVVFHLSCSLPRPGVNLAEHLELLQFLVVFSCALRFWTGLEQASTRGAFCNLGAAKCVNLWVEPSLLMQRCKLPLKSCKNQGRAAQDETCAETIAETSKETASDTLWDLLRGSGLSRNRKKKQFSF